MTHGVERGDEITGTCETCRFWQQWPTESLPHDRRDYGPQGQCRRNAPTMRDQDQHGTRWATWPDTLPYDWCGEHQPRQEQP